MSDVVREIVLDGELGELFGKVHRLAVRTAAEASHALCQTVKGFEAFLWSSKEKGMTFAVFVDGENIAQDCLLNPSTGEIRFVPVLEGAGSGGGIMTVLGAVLVVVGIFLIWTPFGAPLITAGIGLMAGGISMMLAPQPSDQKSEDDANKRASYAFNGPVNTEAQGNPVAVLYGGDSERGAFIGSAVISASIDVEEQAYVPTNPTTNPGGGGSWRSHSSYNAKTTTHAE